MKERPTQQRGKKEIAEAQHPKQSLGFGCEKREHPSIKKQVKNASLMHKAIGKHAQKATELTTS
jgi:hypothetical protein